MNKHLGLIYAVTAYVLWGLAPIFWKQLAQVESTEIVMHRMLWSFVLVLGLIILQRQWTQLVSVLRQPSLLVSLVIASLVISANWAIFIWAVTAGYIVEASMGYFISPLINALFGFVFFKERLPAGQWLALSLVLLAVVYLVVSYGSVPYVALSLALSFACYGAVKKTVSVPATHGLGIESGVVVLPALAYIFYLDQTGVGSFGSDLSVSVLLVLAGLVTLVPLLLFSAAAKLVTLTTLGMSQYVGPTLQLFIGVFLYHEPFGRERLIAFSLIWLAILIFTLVEVKHQRRRRRVLKPLG